MVKISVGSSSLLFNIERLLSEKFNIYLIIITIIKNEFNTQAYKRIISQT